MNTKGIVGSVIAGVVLVQSVFAAPYTPKIGSAERTQLMNRLRPSLGNGKKKAIITPQHFKVDNGWAYIAGSFKYADGSNPGMDYMGGSFSALLHKEGKMWRVKKRTYNGDVIEPEFMRTFPQAPKAIFSRVMVSSTDTIRTHDENVSL